MTKKTTIFAIGILILLSFLYPHHLVVAAQPHPAGTLVQSNSTIWQITEDGKNRMLIDSQEKFYSNRLSFSNVVSANTADLALPKKGMLDGGGSAAMIYDNVYKTGPGRNLPNAVIVQTLP